MSDAIHIDTIHITMSQGEIGPEGKSAYQVAVQKGFTGTEEEWLQSLKGEQGPAGPQGERGEKGEKGDPGPNNIYDGLDSDATDYALSAKQGKVIASTLEEVASDLSQKVNETRIKVLDVEQDVSNISKVLTSLNPNQEAKQSVSGYGIISLPKNAANGQVSVSIFGNTETDEEGNTKSTVGAMRLKSVSADETETSTAYVVAKDEQGKIAELRSLPNGVKDEIRVSDSKLIKRVSDDILLPTSGWQYRGKSTNDNFHIISCNNVAIDSFSVASANLLPTSAMSFSDKSFATYTCNFTYLQNNVSEKTIGKYHTGGSIYLAIPIAEYSQAETNVGANAYVLANLAGTTLTYQLAEPIVTPINVSGNLISYPSGTVYVENVVADAGIYTDKMEVLHSDLPIKALEKISKVDFDTGLETELDITAAVIAEDKLSFTHPDLTSGDIVFFVYEYDRESTVGETEIEYYDSRYVIKDSVTDKFYKWHIAVADGVPSIELVEV